MKKLFFSNGSPIVLNVPTPKILPGMVLVKNSYSFVSRGTELSTLNNTKKKLAANSIVSKSSDVAKKIIDLLKHKGIVSTFYQIKSQFHKKIEAGYATSGVVVDSACEYFRKGDFVACAGANFASHGEFSLVPKNLLAKLDNKNHLMEASISSIAAIALQGLRRANLQLGESLCVVGLGLIGQLTVQLAKLSGLIVVGVDIDQSRQNLALQMGADKVFGAIDKNDNSWVSDVVLFSERLGVDCTIITASNSNSAVDYAINITRQKGKVVVVGDVAFEFSREEFYKKELDLLISCSYGPGRYDKSYEEGGVDYPYSYVRWTEGRNLQLIADLIVSGKLNIEPLISGLYSFEKAKDAYASLLDGSLGVVFEYSTEEKKKSDVLLDSSKPTSCEIKKYKNIDRSQKQHLHICLVGAGGFAKTILAPILTRLDNIILDTVVDKNSASAINFSETFSFLGWTDDLRQVLENDDIDLVVITTPDSTHASLAISALESGKAVFVEKPMVVNYDELFLLKSFLTSNPESFFVADFNRTHSPIIKNIISKTSNRSTPLFINYRVNAGMSETFDKNNTMKRLVGEVCHFFELFLSVTNSFPIKMTVSFSGSNNTSFGENLALALVFSDGSISNLIYSSLAHGELCKERGEFFWDKKSAILEDYKSLIGYGLGKNFDYYDVVPDKGHASLISSFICSIKQNNPKKFSSSWNNYFMASWLSLKLEELVLKNGGTLEIDANLFF